MTTPEQPGTDPQVKVDVIEDLDPPAEAQQQVEGGAASCSGAPYKVN